MSNVTTTPKGMAGIVYASSESRVASKLGTAAGNVEHDDRVEGESCGGKR